MTPRTSITGSALLGLCLLLTSCATPPKSSGRLQLDKKTHDRCVAVLREGMRGDDFWPAIHAAEGLTLGGYGKEVIAFLKPKLGTNKDDQHRCGISREIIRAGDRSQAKVMLDILAGDDKHGHVHAAESLYKVNEIGDGVAMRKRFNNPDGNNVLKLMAGAALARHGDATARRFIRNSMFSSDQDTYRIAAWILGRIGDQRDIPLLRAKLGASKDPAVDAYLNHSLAALGDKAGLAALAANLESEDGPIRTYAATFAGDAGATSVGPQLRKMLDDPHPDARYRAAQSLLFLAR
jgi:sialidase-1